MKQEAVIQKAITMQNEAVKTRRISYPVYVAVFVVACLFGTYWEQLIELVLHNRWITQKGVLYGPFNPVYGFGAVGFVAVLGRKERSYISTVMLSAVVGGVFEYLLHELEIIFTHTESWNYANKFLAVPSIVTGGTTAGTTLPYMFFWGLMGTLVIKGILPLMTKLVSLPPRKLVRITSTVLTIFFSINMLLTGAAFLRQGARRQGIEPSSPVSQWLDQNFGDDVMDKAFPDKQIKEA